MDGFQPEHIFATAHSLRQQPSVAATANLPYKLRRSNHFSEWLETEHIFVTRYAPN
jgi:hypothetical protein